MAATIQSQNVTSPLESSRRGNEVTYEAEWTVVFDESISGPRAIELAQENSTNRLPAKGDPLIWTHDTSAADNYGDANVFALDFGTTPKFTGKNLESIAWVIKVTWRAPQPGNDENPDFNDQPPLSRPQEHWIEFQLRSESITTGYLVTPGLPGNPPPPVVPDAPRTVMKNSAGDAFPPVTIEDIVAVLVAQKNVESPLEALERNDTFRKTTNREAYTVTLRTGLRAFTWTIPAFQSRFLKAETGPPIYERNEVFHRMQVRIEVSDTPYVISRFNEGTSYLTIPRTDFEATLPPIEFRKFRRQSDGTLDRSLVPLQKDGSLVNHPDQYNSIDYMILDQVDYSPFVE